MKTYGLIGFPLTHSFSATYFSEKFFKEAIPDTRYELFPLEEISHIDKLIKNNQSLMGFNVTIPHKINILGFLNEIDDTARMIGSVNTVKIFRNSDKTILKGFNTDAYGFMNSLKPLLQNYHKKALVLGTGGAAKAICYVLNSFNIEYKQVSRTKTGVGIISYQEIDKALISEHNIIINTTPAGMYPNQNEAPAIPYQFLDSKSLLYDLIYNPKETLFLNKGAHYGAITKNGIEMLYLQAEKTWEIWNT